MKPLNLFVGLGLGLFLTGCPGDDSNDDGAGTTTSDNTTGSTSSPMTTDPGDTTVSPPGTTDEPGTTTDEPGTTTDEPGTTTDEPGTTGTTGGPVGVSFEADVYPIIMASCGCHVGGGPGMLSMPDAATAYGNLVDVPSANDANDMDRVEPGDPEASFLWNKVNHTLEPGEGDPMPRMAPMLGEEDLATIEAWIQGGAEA